MLLGTTLFTNAFSDEAESLSSCEALTSLSCTRAGVFIITVGDMRAEHRQVEIDEAVCVFLCQTNSRRCRRPVAALAAGCTTHPLPALPPYSPFGFHDRSTQHRS